MDFSYMEEKNWISQERKRKKEKNLNITKKESQEKYGLKA